MLRRSRYREKFIELTLDQRENGSSRALLEQEWRYLGPLFASLPDGAPILDLACGSGPHTLAWAERGFRVTGIDFDHDLLVAGRRRVSEAAPDAPAPVWTCGDATRLPYVAGSFDAVFCNSLLEHVPAWESVLSEASRVLRPGGVFVMYTTNRTCPLQQEVNHFPFYSWLPGPDPAARARVDHEAPARSRELHGLPGRELVHVPGDVGSLPPPRSRTARPYRPDGAPR
ncbi:MAG: class I SAM-dependent methyltransferase [Candidatus Eisenbacteria bacterium]|nr:class I SAM-dependent methyltransferase [Candidatus Eisenbacteria bacterium]